MAEITSITAYRGPPRWTFVQVSTDDGLSGWGEAIVARRAGAVLGAIGDLARNVTGADPDRIEELWQRMRRGGLACCAGNVVICEQSLGLHYNQGYSELPAGEMLDYLAVPSVLTRRLGRSPVRPARAWALRLTWTPSASGSLTGTCRTLSGGCPTGGSLNGRPVAGPERAPAR